MLTVSDKQKQIYDVLAEGILIIDADTRVVFANKAYRDFLGMSMEEMEGRRLRDFRPHAQLPSVISSGIPVLHAQRLEGLEEAYFVNMYPLRSGGRVVGGLSVITFMSEAEKARTELEKYEAKLSQQLLNRAKKNAAVYTFDKIVAQDPKSLSVKNFAVKIADSEMSVLLQAESGTGKELYAQAIHNASRRSGGVFLAVNCANFNENMLESELFGYEEGAFTGAKKGGKIGLLEAAKGGTIFLDEISEMALGLQSKLLRALQERKIRPVGAVAERNIDVRVICACNADLEDYISAGKFRKDLYYRLNACVVRIPALRDRPEDIPAITYAILDEFSKKHRLDISINAEAMQCLKNYDWPGNVRELRNVVEFSAYMCEDNQIVLGSLPGNLVRASAESPHESLAERVKRFERGEIEKYILKYGDTLEGKKKIAEELNISLATLYNKLNHKMF